MHFSDLWSPISQFSALQVSLSCLCYCGGYIRKMEWCPLCFSCYWGIIHIIETDHIFSVSLPVSLHIVVWHEWYVTRRGKSNRGGRQFDGKRQRRADSVGGRSNKVQKVGGDEWWVRFSFETILLTSTLGCCSFLQHGAEIVVVRLSISLYASLYFVVANKTDML